MPEQAARSWITDDGLREASRDGERSPGSAERRASPTSRRPRPSLVKSDIDGEKVERAATARDRTSARGVPQERVASGAAPRGRSSSWEPNGDGMPGRRTVIIRGQVADRYSPRRAPRAGAVVAGYYRPRPERAAKWAVLLGLLLVIVALLSAHL
jgi:hypothetical protein